MPNPYPPSFVNIRKILKDILICSNITEMDELPSTSVFLPISNYYDTQSKRNYKIRLSNGKLNPRVATALARRFQQGGLRQYINNTYLVPNSLRFAGGKVYDMTNRNDITRFRNAIARQRQQAVVDRQRQVARQARTRELRGATTLIRQFRQRTLNTPIFARQLIDRVNDRTRIFRFHYAFNDRGNWAAQVASALTGSAYLENSAGFNTRTQILISALPANFNTDLHLGGNHLRTTYAASGVAAMAAIIAKKQQVEDEYEGLDWSFNSMLINRILTPIAGQGGGRSESSANKTWLALDKKAKTNCFYNAIATIRLFTQKKQEADNNHKIRVDKMLLNPSSTLDKVCQGGRDLKRNFNPSITNLVDLGLAREYVEYTFGNHNQPTIYIQLYNNIFEKTYLILPREVKNQVDVLGGDKDAIEKLLRKYRRYEIQLINNHFIPLIRWKDIKQPNPVAPIIPTDDTEQDYVIQKYNDKKNKTTGIWEKIVNIYNGRIAAYDLEATPNGVENGDFTTFCASFVYRNPEPPRDIIRKSWYGFNCVKNMIDYLSDNMEFFDKYTIYAHNNGKFDMIQVFKDYVLTDITCPLKVNPDKLIPLNGAYIGVSLYNDKGEIDFKDSLKMLPSSLAKLGQEFNVPHKKLDKVVLPDGREVSINHDDVNIDNVRDYDIRHSQQEYCEWDSMCLLEILEIFSKDVYEATGLNITDCFTGASLSKKHYYKNFYDKREHPIYHLTRDNDKFIRNSYYGGRNEAHFIGQFNGRCGYYDFTSLYPSEGRLRLPYGAPTKIDPRLLEHFSFYERNSISALPFGFYKCLIRTIDKDRKPLHAIKKDARLTFPIFENWTEVSLFSEEIKLGFKNKQYEYEFLEGIGFKNDKFMASFFEDGFAKKGQAKKDGKPALAQVYKIIINSGYGFFGLNTLGKDGNGRDGVNIYEKDTMDFWDLLNSGGLVNIGTMGNYNIVRADKELEITDFNVGVASAITSWARIKIWKFIDDIEKKGGRILYMDTDSAIIDISMKAHQDIMDKYCWDGNGDDLGSMKNEADDEVAGYFAKKIKTNHPTWSKAQIKVATKLAYKWQEKLDGGDLYFDNFIGGGCKQYALIKKLFDGGIIEICKMKGYSKRGKKLHFKDFEKLTKAYWEQRAIENEYEKKCNEMVERIKEATNNDIITQDQIQFRTPLSYHLTDIRVEKWVVKKEFRIGYTKGKVADNGWVSPLHL